MAIVDILNNFNGSDQYDLLANTVDEEVEREDDAESGTITKPWDPARIRVDQRSFSVAQILDMIDDGDLILQPEFQRRRVWSIEQKCLLIESLLLRIPLPAFYFASDEQGQLQVIDGLQRLSTIHDFVRGGPDKSRKFKLQKLEYLGDTLNSKGFDELASQVWGRRIVQSQLIANVVDPQTPPPVKFNIFARLNKQGTPLSQQELRHAMSGPRSRQFLSKLAESLEFMLATDGAVKNSQRMHDIEMALRFCAFQLIGFSYYRQYGSLSEFLTYATNKLDDPKQVPDIKLQELSLSFDYSMRAAYRVFGNGSFRKFDVSVNGRNRTPINKPIFDVWSWIFSRLPLESVIENETLILDTHFDLLDDKEFDNAVSLNTGTSSKVEYRFNAVISSLRNKGIFVDG